MTRTLGLAAQIRNWTVRFKTEAWIQTFVLLSMIHTGPEERLTGGHMNATIFPSCLDFTAGEL